jgi:predicted PurR-regulated permease PerM
MDDALRQRDDDRRFVRRVLITIALFAIAYGLWSFARATWHSLLTVFAGALIGVLLNALARFTARRTRAPRWLALAAVGLAIVGLLTLFWWWMGSSLSEQFQGVASRALEAWVSVREWLEQSSWGRRLISEAREYSPSSEVAGRVGGLVTSTLGALGTTLLIVFFAVYFAATPRLYIEGALHLFPTERRDHVRHALFEIGHGLESWLVGRFLSMAIVGVGTAIGLWIAGVPMPIGLALIAGIFSFVPNVGPILAAISGLLVAATVGPMTVVWALVVYLAVQAVDNYLATPLIDQRVVSLPPALLLAFQLLMGLAAGVIGLFMATPIAVALIIAIQIFYVRDVLGDRISLLGRDSSDTESSGAEPETRPPSAKGPRAPRVGAHAASGSPST